MAISLLPELSATTDLKSLTNSGILSAMRDIERDLPKKGSADMASVVASFKAELPRLRENWLALCKREIFGELEEGTNFEHNIKHFKLKY